MLLFLFSLMSSITTVSMVEPGCSRPLGLMTGEIEDWQLSASSVKVNDPGCQIKFARLHHPGAWCAEASGRGDTHHWLLVDLGVMTDVSGAILQGRGDEPEWVTLFSLAFSEDAYKWNIVKDIYDQKMIFQGNMDSHRIKTIWLDKAVIARFVRVHILEWHRHPSLRLELLGCQECASVITSPGIGSLTASSYGSWKRKHSCQPEDSYIHSNRAWCSKHNNGEQWLQFDLGPPKTITGVMTKGRGDKGLQWVTSYQISYSNDSTVWYFYKEVNHLNAKSFGGNMDKITERRHYFNTPFVARYVRIHPVRWENSISMRAALLGCPTQLCPPNFFRMNPLTPCIENLAWKGEIWSNDKKHIWKDWKYGHASLAVDGDESVLLPQCAVLDNYYTESPIWMVDLGRKRELTGIIIVTWQGDGQDQVTSYRDYTLNIERLTVHLSNKPRLEVNELSIQPKCGSISRENNAVFHPRIRIDCGNEAASGRYVYIHATPVLNRYDRIFSFVLCEVIVFKI